jgi:lactate 2-monooxygenase
MSKDYGQYHISIYGNGMYAGGRPVVTTDPRILEEQARKAMDSKSFTYIAGGAGERATMDSNRLAFRHWKLYVQAVLPQADSRYADTNNS